MYANNAEESVISEVSRLIQKPNSDNELLY